MWNHLQAPQILDEGLLTANVAPSRKANWSLVTVVLFVFNGINDETKKTLMPSLSLDILIITDQE